MNVNKAIWRIIIHTTDDVACNHYSFAIRRLFNILKGNHSRKTCQSDSE